MTAYTNFLLHVRAKPVIFLCGGRGRQDLSQVKSGLCAVEMQPVRTCIAEEQINALVLIGWWPTDVDKHVYSGRMTMKGNATSSFEVTNTFCNAKSIFTAPQ